MKRPCGLPESLVPGVYIMNDVKGKYVHYKGNEYEVIGVAKHSETLEPMVVYKALYGEGGLWVRPYGMFFETVEVNGEQVPRFKKID
jgi:hypothetical protein